MASSDESDAFTTEYRKILKQLPSMLGQSTDSIPPHLQNYLASQSQSGSIHSSEDSKRRRRSSSSKKRSRESGSSRRRSKYHIEASSHRVEQPSFGSSNDLATMHELQRINEMLSARKPEPLKEITLEPMHLTTNATVPAAKLKSATPIRTQRKQSKSASTQTTPTKELKAEKAKAVSVPSLVTVETQTDPEPKAAPVFASNTKMSGLMAKLTNELSDSSIACQRMKEENAALESELRRCKKESIDLRVGAGGIERQIEDQRIYAANLLKHLDEKTRNEAALRKEMFAQQKQLETAHLKLQHLLQPKQSHEVQELRAHLMAAEQRCADWKKKWKQQCCKLEHLESEKIMSQHRVDQQLADYQKIIEDFRNMMKNNLQNVNANFHSLHKDNVALKAENERLLIDLGRVQENAFMAKHKEKEALAAAQSQSTERAMQTEREPEIEKVPARDAEADAAAEAEFDHMSVAVYELIIEIRAKSAEIVHEYGFKSLSSSPRRGRKSACDTDDDATSVLVTCRKRFAETRLVLQQLLRWFDDVMYEQAEKQCDRCITQ